MTPTVFAHFGHWYASVLYLAPVVAVVVALTVTSLRERRRGEGTPQRSSSSRDGDVDRNS
jgi:cytochrome c-type biogenesis protein CcmH/NrfF